MGYQKQHDNLGVEGSGFSTLPAVMDWSSLQYFPSPRVTGNRLGRQLLCKLHACLLVLQFFTHSLLLNEILALLL